MGQSKSKAKPNSFIKNGERPVIEVKRNVESTRQTVPPHNSDNIGGTKIDRQEFDCGTVATNSNEHSVELEKSITDEELEEPVYDSVDEEESDESTSPRNSAEFNWVQNISKTVSFAQRNMPAHVFQQRELAREIQARSKQTGAPQQQSSNLSNAKSVFDDERDDQKIRPRRAPPVPPQVTLKVDTFFTELNKLNQLGYMERMKKLEEHAKSLEDAVYNFQDEKDSALYSELTEKLLILIDSLDEINCPPHDSQVKSEKIRLTGYIKNLNYELDKRALIID